VFGLKSVVSDTLLLDRKFITPNSQTLLYDFPQMTAFFDLQAI